MNRAVFLDRDGVLVKASEIGHGPLTLEQFRLLPDIREPLLRLRKAGYLLVLATNQPGIARGTLTREVLNEMHRRLEDEIALDAVYVCPHTDADGCACRKPKPGLLLQAARELTIDLAGSFFVGDTERDTRAGERAGVRTILLDCEYNRDLTVAHRVRDVAAAADVILGYSR
jgi:D-glycero-D-manno-heptose 1,7-bisphosphate phosphatase